MNGSNPISSAELNLRCNGSTFSKKSTSHTHTEASLPQGCCLQYYPRLFPGVYGTSTSWVYLSICQWLLSVLVGLDALQQLCPDLTSVVLTRNLPGALNRLVLPATLPFCFAKIASWWLCTTTTTSDLETGNTIPELSIPLIPILIVLILGSWHGKFNTILRI